MKKTFSATKGVVKDDLIVPGKRIGPVAVGMSVSQLYDVMGARPSPRKDAVRSATSSRTSKSSWMTPTSR
jgi:hypothetical protein